MHSRFLCFTNSISSPLPGLQKIIYFAKNAKEQKMIKFQNLSKICFFRPSGTSPRVFSQKNCSFALVYVDFRATATHFVTMLIFCKKMCCKNSIFCKKCVAKNVIFCFFCKKQKRWEGRSSQVHAVFHFIFVFHEKSSGLEKSGLGEITEKHKHFSIF